MAKTWQHRVRQVYTSPEELEAYDEVYGIATRCGFPDAAALWQANPMIGGSTDPKDFGVVHP